MAETNINNPYKKLTLMLYRCGFNKRNIPRLLTKKKILHIKHSISLINQNFILQQTEIFDQTTNHNYCFFAQLTLPTAKAGGFLLQPLLHWLIRYGIATSYTVSTS